MTASDLTQCHIHSYTHQPQVGTSIPDAIGSMVAAKHGEANMAIANAVGSNVFDILLGLGLPWTLSSWFSSHNDGYQVVNTEGITIFVAILLGTVFLFVSILIAFKWNMSSGVGGVMFLLYLVFFVFCLTYA